MLYIILIILYFYVTYYINYTDKNEVIETSNRITLKYGSFSREVYDIPYLQALGGKFLPGGGANSISRFSSFVGLNSFSHTTLNYFYTVACLDAMKVVYKRTIQESMEIIIHNYTSNSNCDGISKYYQVCSTTIFISVISPSVLFFIN